MHLQRILAANNMMHFAHTQLSRFLKKTHAPMPFPFFCRYDEATTLALFYTSRPSLLPTAKNREDSDQGCEDVTF